MRNIRLVVFSILIVAFSLPLTEALQLPASAASMEVTSKRYSSGYTPVVGSYVEYEVRLTNKGGGPIENQSLRVSLVSENNATHSYAEYTLSSLGPDESKIFHLGPFKMEEEGGHRLLAEMDGMVLDYKPDLFSVYRQETLEVVYVAVSLVAAGAALAGFSVYRKRRAV
jgi:hypothetical protein